MTAGKHVYVEKPLTLNHADSKQLVDYAVAHDRKLTIGYTYYFDPPALELRDRMQQCLGAPDREHRYHRDAPARRDPSSAGSSPPTAKVSAAVRAPQPSSSATQPKR